MLILPGGTNVPFQEAAVSMLEPNKVRQEMKALQTHFKEKRDYVLDRLRKLGFKFNHIPDSTFYIWLDLSGLPDAICDGLSFFEECLKERVIVGRLAPILIHQVYVVNSSSAGYLLRPQSFQAKRSFRQSLSPLCASELWTEMGELDNGPRCH